MEVDFDLEGSLETGWRGSGILDRVSTPYVGLAPLTDTCVDWSVHYNKDPFLWRLKDLYIGAMCGETHMPLTSIGKYVTSISKSCNVLARTLLQSLTREDLFEVHKFVYYMHHLRTYWWEGKVAWFMKRAYQKAYCHYLEGSDPIGFTHLFERVAFSKTCLNWQNVPLSADDLDDYYSESVVYEPVCLAPGKQINTAPAQVTTRGSEEEEIKHVSILREEKCSCGLQFEILSLPYADLREDHFPDALRGRSCAWYSKNSMPYSYNGGKHESMGWPRWLDLWMQVNRIQGTYDCMLAQRYEQGGKIGFHADDEPLFEPGQSILTANVEGTASFSVRCKQGEGCFDLHTAEQFTMPEGMQISHKHSVISKSEGRISYTFRTLRKRADEQASEVCNIPPVGASEGHCTYMCGVLISAELDHIFDEAAYDVVRNRGGGDCFWLAMEHFTGVGVQTAKAGILNVPWDEEYKPRLLGQLLKGAWAEDEAIAAVCKHLGYNIIVYDCPRRCRLLYSMPSNQKTALLKLDHGHFEAIRPIEMCTVRAIAQALRRTDKDVLAVLLPALGEGFERELLRGKGLSMLHFERMLEFFDLSGLVCDGEQTTILNEAGKVKCCFKSKGITLSMFLQALSLRLQRLMLNNPV